MSKLVLKNVAHRNSDNFAISIDELVVEEGEIVCLLGPSGCGKSTTLRLVAGLERPASGEIMLGDKTVANGKQFVPTEERHIGLVFQDYALFPHLKIKDNVTFGLNGAASAKKRETAEFLLSKLGLDGFLEKYPHMLSGGEQQRVALARALAPNPKLLLMDEPFSGLDTILKDRIREETMHLLRETGTTVLLVTHDPEEAMQVADRIVLMKDGQIAQIGTPQELYSSPVNEFVASFLGRVNKVHARSVGGILETDLGQVPNGAAREDIADCDVFVRPEAIRLGPVRGEGEVTAKAVAIRNLGAYALIELELKDGKRVTARAASILQPELNEELAISLDRKQVFLFS